MTEVHPGHKLTGPKEEEEEEEEEQEKELITSRRVAISRKTLTFTSKAVKASSHTW
jgi:hypothetical protein